jgi:hypothetical protein
MQSAPLKAGLHVFAVSAILLTALTIFGRHYVEACLPLYREMLIVLRPNDRVRFIRLDDRIGTVVRVETERVLVMKDELGRLRDAMVVGNASTQGGYALTHLFIVLGAPLMWPGFTLRACIERMVLSLPILFVIEAMDIPLVLSGSIDNVLMSGNGDGSKIDWIHLLDGGGRYAVCLVAAYLVSVAQLQWSKQRSTGVRPDAPEGSR